MTDEQLEAAARKLCEIRGIDAEKRVAADAGGCDVYMTEPAWLQASREVIAFHQVARAVDFALGGEQFP
jgi:hypothetical protein